MKHLRLAIALGAIVALALSSAPAFAHHGDDHNRVWVCKYVGKPGDFEALKPGKNPIIVDVAAADDYVGADFADGQNHSYVIDLATDENTGQGEKYIGDAKCPSPPTPTPSPSSEPTASPSPSPSPTPVVTPDPTSTPTPSTSPSATPTTPSPSETPQSSPSASSPASSPSDHSRMTLPPTSTVLPTASSISADLGSVIGGLAIVVLATIGIDMLIQRRRRGSRI